MGLGIVTFVLEFPTKLLKLSRQAGRLAETELTPAEGILYLLNTTISTFHSFPPSLLPYSEYLILQLELTEEPSYLYF